jgi:hypothetical protein
MVGSAGASSTRSPSHFASPSPSKSIRCTSIVVVSHSIVATGNTSRGPKTQAFNLSLQDGQKLAPPSTGPPVCERSDDQYSWYFAAFNLFVLLVLIKMIEGC